MEPSKGLGYWFPAKRYGWGWGLPCAWQGWVVLAAFVVLLSGGAWLMPPPAHGIALGLYAAVLVVLLVAVVAAKGEPPGWRWGDDR